MDDSIQSDTMRDAQSHVIHASKGVRVNLQHVIEQSKDDSVQSDTVHGSQSNIVHSPGGIRSKLRRTIEASQVIVPEKDWEADMNRKRKTRSTALSPM